jgi:hypothetical protein
MKYLIPVTFLIGCGALANAADMQPTDSLFSAKELEYNYYGDLTFYLRLNPGYHDRHNCAGKYVKSLVTKIRGKPVFFSKQRRRVIFSSGTHWMISSFDNFLNNAMGSQNHFYRGHLDSCDPRSNRNCMGPRYRSSFH